MGVLLFGRVILHRPDDPMVFCRDLLETNIEERGGKNIPFDPACAPHLLKVRYMRIPAMISKTEGLGG